MGGVRMLEEAFLNCEPNLLGLESQSNAVTKIGLFTFGQLFHDSLAVRFDVFRRAPGEFWNLKAFALFFYYQDQILIKSTCILKKFTCMEPLSPTRNVGANMQQFVDMFIWAIRCLLNNNVIDAFSSTPVGIKCPLAVILSGFSWSNMRQANWIG